MQKINGFEHAINFFKKGIAFSLLISFGLIAHANPKDTKSGRTSPYLKENIHSEDQCNYTLSSTSMEVAGGDGSIRITVSTSSSCVWPAAVAANTSWIRIPPNARFTGSGSVECSYEANPTSVSRTGTLTIGNKTLTVKQAGVTCTYTLPTTPVDVAAGGGNSHVSITATGTDCEWTAISNTSWIRIPTGQTLVGTKDLNFTCDANTSRLPREGTMTVGGQTVAVKQAGAACTYRLSGSTLNAAAAGGSEIVTVTGSPADCVWTAVSNAAWLTSQKGTTANGATQLTVNSAANQTSVSRTGTLTIGNKTITVTQAGATCDYTLLPGTLNAAAAGGSEIVTVTGSPADCVWTAVSNAAWLTSQKGTTANGATQLTVNSAANQTSVSRTGTLTIGNKTITVTQAGATCDYTLLSGTINAVAAGGSEVVTVTGSPADCPWTAVSNAAWLTSQKGTTANGATQLTVNSAANQTSVSRTGTLTIGNKTITVTQAGATCNYTLLPGTLNAVAAGGSEIVTVTGSPADCPCTAVSNAGWLTSQKGTTASGATQLTVNYAVNLTSVSRTGTLTIGDKTITVTQAGATCDYTLLPGTLNAVAAGGSEVVTVTGSPADCPCTAVSNAAWLTSQKGTTASGATQLTVNYAVNLTSVSRTGTLTIGNKTITVTQAGATCNYTLLPGTLNAVAAGGSEIVTVTGSPADCPCTAVSNAGWLTSQKGTTASGATQLTVNYAVNLTSVSRTGTLTIGDKTITVTQAGATCDYTLLPGTLNAVAAGGSEVVTVTGSPADCPCTAVSNAAWLTSQKGTTASGATQLTVNYAVNLTSVSRTGTLTIGNKTITVTQAGATCNYTLLPGTLNAVAAEGSEVVTVTGSPADCPWTAVSNAAWLTSQKGTTASGATQLTVNYAVNLTSVSRTGTLTIGDKTITVTQAGATCNYTLLPGTLNAVAAGGSEIVTVTGSPADCPCTAVSNAAWLTSQKGTTASGATQLTVNYAASALGVSRTGTLTIGDKTITVTQAGVACAYTLSTSTINAVAAEGSATVTVTGSPADCVCTPVSNAGWLTFQKGTTASGATQLRVNYAASALGVSRTGTLTIGDKTITVTQAGVACAYTLSTSTINAVAAEGSATVTVTGSPADCVCTPVSNVGWLTFQKGTTASGATQLTVNYAASALGVSRTGTLTIGDKTITVTQAGVACAYTLSTSTINAVAAEGSATVTVTGSPADCVCTPVSNVGWLTFQKGTTASGATQLTVNYAASALGVSRTGTLTIGDKTITVTQAGVACAYTLSTSTINAVAAEGSATVTVTGSPADCVCTPVSNVGWLTFQKGTTASGATQLTVNYAASALGVSRTGTLTIGDKTITVTQAGVACAYTLSTSTINAVAAEGSATVTVTGSPADCVCTPVSNAAWLTFQKGTSANGATPLTVNYAVNLTSVSRTGTLTIGNKTITVTQGGVACDYRLSGSTINAAAAGGSEIVTVTGSPADCVCTPVSNAGWLTFQKGTTANGATQLTVNYAASALGVSRTGTLTIGDKTITVTQAGVACAYTLSTSTINAVAAEGSATVTVTGSPADCVCTPVSNVGWLTFQKGTTANGVTPLTVNYAASALGVSRTGTLTIGDKTITVTQAGVACAYTLSTSTINAVAAEGSATVTVTGSPADCVCTPVSNAGWLTFQKGTTASGATQLTVNYAASALGVSRTGTLTIGDKTITVTQAGVACAYTLSTSTINAVAAEGSATVTVTGSPADCVCTPVSNAGWLTFQKGTTANGATPLTVNYAASALGVSRTGTLTIGDKTITVTQAGVACAYTLSTSTINAVAAEGSATVTVTGSPADCVCTPVSNAGWLTFQKGTTANGATPLTVNYAASALGVSRTGTLTIGDKTITVTQAGVACAYTLSTSTINAAAAGGSEIVTVTGSPADCVCTPVSNAGWLTFQKGTTANGVTPLTVNYAASALGVSRTGTLTIGDKTITVTQAGVACAYTLSTSTINAVAAEGSATVTVTGSPADCVWTAVSNAAWLTSQKGTTANGATQLTVNYAVNLTSVSRTGTLTIGDKTITVTQAGVACAYTLSTSTINAVAAEGSATVTVTGSPADCVCTPVSNAGWLTFQKGTTASGATQLTVNYAASALGVSRTGTLTIGDKTITVTQAGVACAYTLSTSTINAVAAEGSATVTVTGSPADCVCTPVSNAGWLTFQKGTTANGATPLTVNYAASALGVSRTGTLTIGDKTITVTQAGVACAYTLSTSTINAVAAEGSATVTVTGSPADCVCTPVSNAGWLTFQKGTTANGATPLTVNYAASALGVSRTGTLTIGDKTITVTQAGVACAYTLSTSTLNAVAAEGSATVTVTGSPADCVCTPVSNVGWLTFQKGTTANGVTPLTVNYAASALGVSRTGTLTIGDKTITVTQAGVACAYTLSTSTINAVAAEGSATVTVTGSPADCVWTAVSNAAWLTSQKGTTANGATQLTVNYAVNLTSVSRTGTLTIGNKTITVTQAGATCDYTLLPGTLNAAAAGGSEVVTVTGSPADCPCTAVSNAAWLTSQKGTTANGATQLTVNYAANQTSVSRTGTLTIGNKTITVTQAGATCNYTLLPGTLNAAAAGGSEIVTVTGSPADCPCTAVSNAAWLTSQKGTTANGATQLTVNYAVNLTSVSRTGTLTIGNKTITVTQAGATCNYTLLPGTLNAAAAGGSEIVTVTGSPADCPCTAVSNAAWLTSQKGTTANGATQLTVNYAVNLTSVSRTGTLTIGNKTITVTQAGVTCTYMLPTTPVDVAAVGGSSRVSVATATDCAWTATVVTGTSWITITQGQTLVGTKDLNFTCSPNTASAARTGTITVAGQTITVTQAGVACTYTVSANTLNVPSAAGSNETVKVTVGPSDCVWPTVSSNASWLVAAKGVTTLGATPLLITYPVNPSSLPRDGRITVGDQTITVTQAGVACTYTVSDHTLNVPSAAGSNATVKVTVGPSDCVWPTVSSNASWLVAAKGVTTLGATPLLITYPVNPSSLPRDGRITVGDQTITVTQAGVACTYTVSANTLTVPSAAGSNETVKVTVGPSDCVWPTVSSNASWLVAAKGVTTLGATTLLITYQVNTSSLPRDGRITVGDQTITVTQAGVACSYTLPTTPVDVAAGGGSSHVSVTATGTDCAWTATSNTSWIRIPTGQTLVGTKDLNFSCEENTSRQPREGTMTVGGQTVAVKQAGVTCTYTLPTTPVDVAAGGGSSHVSVRATATDCEWTATTSTSWITIPQGQTLVGTKDLNFTCEENTSRQPREGTMTVGGQTVAVKQAGVTCTYTLPTTPVDVAAVGGSSHVSVTATGTDCEWTATTSTSWITIPQGQTLVGTKDLNFTCDANTSRLPREGTMTVGGQTVAVKQAGVMCSYTLPTTPVDVAAGGGSSHVSVTATGTDCEWTATTSTSWITIPQGQTLVGTKDLNFTCSPNTASAEREGTMTVGGQTVAVKQAGVTCTYTLPTTPVDVAAGGGSSHVSVRATATDCEWTATTSTSWIRIPTGQTLVGTKDLNFTYDANTSRQPREGTMTVGGQTVRVKQAGVTCSYTLPTTPVDVAAGGGNSHISITATGTDCEWTATSNTSWIRIPTGQTLVGTKDLNFSCEENTSRLPREGTMTVGGQTVTVKQAGVVCATTLPATPVVDVAAGGGSSHVRVTATGTDCVWTPTVATGTPWLTITSGQIFVGTKDLNFSCEENTSRQPREGTMTVGGQTVRVKQAGVTCSYMLPTTPVDVAAGGGGSHISVRATGTDCEWTATSNTSWITIPTGQTLVGTKDLNFTCEENTSRQPREGTMAVGGQTVRVKQAGVTCSYTLPTTPVDVAAGGGSSHVSVTATGTDCEWTATTSTSWITIPQGQTLKGTKDLNFTCSPNTASAERTGTMTVGGQTVAVKQAGVAACTYTLSTDAINALSSVGGNGNVTVTANPSSCTLPTVTSDAPWLTFQKGQTVNGATPLTVTYTANPTSGGRTGRITIADKTFTVTQAGVPCTYTLSSSNTIHADAEEGTNSVTVTASPNNCPWPIVTSNAAWLTFQRGATDQGETSLTISHAANTTGAERTGTITVADKVITVTQRPPCTYTLSTNATNAINAPSAGGNSVVMVTASPSDCVWPTPTISQYSAWLTFQKGTTVNGVTPLTVNYTANPTSTARTGTIIVAGKTITVTQEGATVTCSYTLPTAPITVPSTGGGRDITVTSTATNCQWSATTADSWIIITLGQTLVGSKDLHFTCPPNTSSTARTGTIIVAGKTITVTQEGFTCTYTLSPHNSIQAPSAGGNEIVTVTANSSSCTWPTVTSDAPWLTVQKGQTVNGATQLTVNYAGNSTSAARTGIITIADKTFTVTQAGACSYTLPSTSISVPSAEGTGTVRVTAGSPECVWTATTNTSWITIAPDQTLVGTKELIFSYPTNPTSAPREGTITIAGATVTVTQAGACSYTLPSTSISVPSAEGTGTVRVTAGSPECVWTATTSTSWITIAPDQTLVGTKELIFSYPTNSTGAPREGTITIADKTITVTQAGATCSYTLPSIPIVVPSAEGIAGKVMVITSSVDCPWTATSNASWITIASGQTLVGSKDLIFSYGTNPTSAPREGTITIAGQTVIVRQAGACTYTVAPSSISVPSAAGTGQVTVSATSGDCPWEATSNDTWIKITTAAPLAGNKDLTFSYEGNTSTSPRTGTITVAGQTVTVTQAGFCIYAFSTTKAEVRSAAGMEKIKVFATAGCTWTVRSQASWIKITSEQGLVGENDLTFSYDENRSRLPRTGTITVADQMFTLRQLGVPCSYTIPTASITVPPAAGKGKVSVAATFSECSWTPISDDTWIIIPEGSFRGSKDLDFSYEANTTGASREGKITIGGQTCTVTQSATSVATGFETVSPVKIFPNPAKDFVTIEISSSDQEWVSLKITNMFGQVLYERENPEHKMRIPLTGFSSGLYFILLQGKEKAEAQKLIIE